LSSKPSRRVLVLTSLASDSLVAALDSARSAPCARQGYCKGEMTQSSKSCNP
jgi:hypothetical protein